MRVPRLIPQETIKTPPTPRATAPGPEAFGGSIASALSQAGSELEAHAKRMQEERDAIKGLNLTVEAQQRVTNILYGENGYMLQEGLNADGVYKRFSEDYNKIIEEIAAKAENTNQRNVLIQSMLRQLPAYQSQISKHEAAEMQKARVQQLNANLASLTEAAIASKGDPEAMATLTQEAERVVTAIYGSYGEEPVKLAMDEWHNNVHSGIISNLLANDELEAAKNYYEQNKDKISTANQTKIEGFINDKEEVIFVQETGYKIFQQFGLQNEEGALEYIRENFSGERENKLMTYVQGIYVDERRFEAERYDNYLNSIVVRISSAGSLTDALKIIEESNLDPKDKLSLQNQTRSNYEKSDVGRWQSFKDYDYILWRVTLPPDHPEAIRSEAEIFAMLGGRFTKEEQKTIYQAWRTRDAHPELHDSIYKAMSDYNISEALSPRVTGDVYDTIDKRQAAEKRILTKPEVESIIREAVRPYITSNFGRNVPPEIDQWFKNKFFPGYKNDPKALLECQEAYLEIIDAMGGATGQAQISPTTHYAIAEALTEDVVVSQGLFKKYKLKGYQIYNMGGILKEAPDGSWQWYIDVDGELMPAWEVLGGMPIDRRKR
jgi:guanyl-specific ribonuclease Sa